MKFLKVLAVSVALLTTVRAVQQPSSHTKGTPTGKPTGPLNPGQYSWKPQLSPSGLLMVLVSIPQQTMHVYRNGILIGRFSVRHRRAAPSWWVMAKRQCRILHRIPA